MQIIAEYYLIYSQIVFSHLHFCFFRLLPVSLSFRLPSSCLFILIFVLFAYLRSFRPNCIRASALLSRHISTKLGRSPVFLFLRLLSPNGIGLHRHRSKTAFFLPLLQKNRYSLANIRFFSYLCSPKLKYIRA